MTDDTQPNDAGSGINFDGPGAGDKSGSSDSTPSTPKMIPESDLLAVKEGAKKQIDTLKLQLSDSKKTADTNYTEMLRLRTSNEELETKLGAFASSADTIAAHEKTIANITAAREASDNRSIELMKRILVNVNGIKVEQLEGKSLQELNTLEEALKLVGGKSSGNSYDEASGGGSGLSPDPLGEAISKAKARPS